MMGGHVAGHGCQASPTVPTVVMRCCLVPPTAARLSSNICGTGSRILASSAVQGIDASCRLIETDDEPCSGTKDRDREASPTNHRLAGDVDTLCIGDL